jgi:atonal protein 8
MMATDACRAEELLRASCCSRLVADDDELHSPTDASEDSVEVKVLPILALSKKNKRKLAEPRKVPLEGKAPSGGPAKRSRRVAPRVTELVTAPPAPSPFRPWSESKPIAASDEPLSLVLRPNADDSPSPALCGAKPTVPKCESVERRRTSSKFSVESLLGGECASGEAVTVPRAPSTAGSSRNAGQHPVQRNYKNMTRERRIEANARERTRVHTISAAFDTLRKSIPSYSHSQKLSKLSILRIACSYIVALSRVNGLDYSEGEQAPSIAECVETVSRTLHAEGKVRKKKDD